VVALARLGGPAERGGGKPKEDPWLP